MNLSKSKKTIRTKDGIPLKEGMTVYHVSFDDEQIFKMIVKHWNDGKTAKSSLSPNDKTYVDISLCGGPGIYDADIDEEFYRPNNYVPIFKELVSEVYACKKNAKKSLIPIIKGEIEAILCEAKNLLDQAEEKLKKI